MHLKFILENSVFTYIKCLATNLFVPWMLFFPFQKISSLNLFVISLFVRTKYVHKHILFLQTKTPFESKLVSSLKRF